MSETTSAGEGQKRSRTSRPLTDEEVAGLIGRNFIAVLATAADHQPWAVPLIYGYEDNAFYSVVTPGRKVRNIEQNPNVCLTIVETADMGKRWKSVVATGTAAFVEEEAGQLKGLECIRRQYPGLPGTGGGAASLKGFHMLRVGVQEMTGRGHD